MSTTPPSSPADRRSRAARWATPATSIVLGGVFCVASALGGSLSVGLTMLAIMVGFAGLLLVVAPRSETVSGLMDRRDERITAIDQQATALTGFVLILAVLGGFAWEIAHRRSGMPYLWLGAVAGITYLGAVVALRVRR